MNEPTRQHEPPVTAERYLVLCWLCSAAALAYVQRNSPGASESAIRSELHLTLREMGLVLSSFFWGYTIFQIPSGWLADRWGTRRLLSLIAFVWTLATAALALATGFASLVTWRFLGGSAQAGIFSCASRTIAQWFPNSERGMTSGFLGGFMSAGGAFGALATGVLLPVMSWRSILLVYAIPGLIWSALFYIWFRDRPEERADIRKSRRGESSANVLSHLTDRPRPTQTPPQVTPWTALLQAPAIWWLSAQQFFRAAGYMFYASWFATFLQETWHIPQNTAAVLMSIPLWCVVVGSPLGGFLSDWVFTRTDSRRAARSGVAAVSMLGCAMLMLLAYSVESIWLGVLLLSAASFWSAIGGPCAYAVTIDVGGSHVGTVFSVMNMCGNIGAAVLPLVVPPFVAATGGWDCMLLLLAGIYVAAGICWILVNPNDTISTATDSPS